MMTFLRSILPSHTDSMVASRGGLAVIRDRILQTMLLALLALGIPVVSLAVIDEVRRHNWGLIALYALMLVVLILIICIRRLAYPLRASTIIVLIYVLAVTEFFDSGLPSEMRFYLMAGSVFTATFLGFWPGLAATLAGFLAMFTLNLGITNHWIPVRNITLFLNDPNRSTGAWMFLLLSSGVTISIAALLNGIQSSLKEKEQYANDLEKQRTMLEETVQNRTIDIQRRLVQVRTSAEISRVISRLSDAETLFDQVVELLCERMELYYVGIFTIDATGQAAVLRAGTGDAGKFMLAHNHHLPVGGNSMIGWCIANRQPRIAMEVAEETVRFNNPYLPLTRSEIALPILSHGEILGAMTIQSTQPRAFDQNDILVLQGITDSISIAVENSRLAGELTQNQDEINTLNRNYLQGAWAEVVTQLGAVSAAYESGKSADTEHTGKVVSFPILLRDQMIGQVALETENDKLSEEDTALLDAISTQTALALENARLVQESERRVYQEQKLNDLTARFSRANDIEGILRTAAEQLGQLPSVAEVTVQLVTPGGIAQSISEGHNGGNGKDKLA